MIPKVVTLRVWIGDVGRAYAQHLLADGRIREQSRAQSSPIPALATGNDVVNRGQGVSLVGEMAMVHRFSIHQPAPDVPSGPGPPASSAAVLPQRVHRIERENRKCHPREYLVRILMRQATVLVSRG